MSKRKRKYTRWIVVGAGLIGAWVFLALLVTAATAEPLSASDSFEITWDVIANGGSTMSSDSFNLVSTSGQAYVGETSSASYSLTSGFWSYWVSYVRDVFMPLILKL